MLPTSKGELGPEFDVAVIGAGVVGCAVARRLTLAGLRTVVLERACDILAGASKANSALLHTGFDAPPDSLELSCMCEGYAEYLAIRERLNLPLLETGAAVVAWSEAHLARLDEIEARARQSDVVDIRRVSPAELLEREPHLAPTCLGGLLVPGEHVIDPWSAPLAYLRQAVANGAEARFDAEVQGGEFARGRWTLQTTAGPVEAALTGPLPARDFGGLKRRTRAGMGRCQGFYCGAELAALTAGRFAAPLAVGTVRG